MEGVAFRKLINGLLLSVTFLSLGFLMGFSGDTGQVYSSGETLQQYPMDLSMIGIHRHQKQFVTENIPDIEVKAYRDQMMASHFNLHLETTNFTFTPEKVSSDYEPNEGHAHIYVDDVLISRSYSDWYHLPRLKPGNHTVKVTLNTNNHKEYQSNKGLIQDEIQISVPRS